MNGSRPEVSILIETANLAAAELGNLSDCLESLGRQTYPIEREGEVILIEASESAANREAVLATAREHPWVQVITLEPGTGYGDLKALSGSQGKGEIIVLCDSDCRYEPTWLEELLGTFSTIADAQVVSGETTTPIDGSYGLAIALTFVFPRYSHETRPAPARWYWANNVAMRRTFFEALPLPPGLPLYRGQNIVHAKLLEGIGYQIWRQPAARAIHQLPRPTDVLQRYFRFGYDMVVLARLVGDRGGRRSRRGMEPNPQQLGRLAHFGQRMRSVLGEDRRRVAYLPLAAPVVAGCVGAYLLGMATAWLRAPRTRLEQR